MSLPQEPKDKLLGNVDLMDALLEKGFTHDDVVNMEKLEFRGADVTAPLFLNERKENKCSYL